MRARTTSDCARSRAQRTARPAEALSQVKFEVEAYRRVRHEQMARFKSLQRDSRIALTQPPGGTVSRGDAPSGGRAFDWVGRAVRHFRQDVNAPHGALCRATVVRYSPAERRHLLVYSRCTCLRLGARAIRKDHLPDPLSCNRAAAVDQPFGEGVLLELAAAPAKPTKASAGRSPVLPSNVGNTPARRLRAAARERMPVCARAHAHSCACRAPLTRASVSPPTRSQLRAL